MKKVVAAVVPAKAGTQGFEKRNWTPAFAGATSFWAPAFAGETAEQR
jgi:hypothetical protein